MLTPVLIDSWKKILHEEMDKPYFHKLLSFVQKEMEDSEVFPKWDNIFNAFNKTPLKNIKVVIIGQDPYHGKNQAHGLAFSVLENTSLPPSLRNIFQEYSSDLGYEKPKNGNLSKWAQEGVFLINAVLSVRENKPHSHQKQGWEIFTNKIIEIISKEQEHVVFILWGKPAQEKEKIIDKNKHLILKSPHPSPLSAYRGFFGSKPFSKTNSYLKKYNIKPIDWKLRAPPKLI